MVNLIEKIRKILSNDKLDLADKLVEIENVLPKEEQRKNVEISEIFGQKCRIIREGNRVIYDGSYGKEYTDNPNLKNPNDLYYTGCGCTWGIDVNGKRYWKRYNSSIMEREAPGSDKSYVKYKYSHLSDGDIVNEKERMKRLIKECLEEIGY